MISVSEKTTVNVTLVTPLVPDLRAEHQVFLVARDKTLQVQRGQCLAHVPDKGVLPKRGAAGGRDCPHTS